MCKGYRKFDNKTLQQIITNFSKEYFINHLYIIYIAKYKHMNTIIFYWYLLTGTITPMGDVDGRTIYKYDSIEYAYKEELIAYIDNDVFMYNEDLKD